METFFMLEWTFSIKIIIFVMLLAVDAPPQPQVDGTAPTFSKKPTIRQVDR